MAREDVPLGVDRREMTLREAVDLFASMPEADQWRCGIGIHEPYVRMLNGRPVAVGFLNAASIRWLIEGGSEFPEGTPLSPNPVRDRIDWAATSRRRAEPGWG